MAPKKGIPFNPFNPLPLLLISSLLFQKWKTYATSPGERREKKHHIKKSKDINELAQTPQHKFEIKNEVIEYKFERMNIPNAVQKFEKPLEKLEFEKDRELPNYPCTKKYDNNLIND